MANDCIFCRIATGTMPCHRVWEDPHHLAFLSIFPNTPGFTVVIPKAHHPSYAFALDDPTLCALVVAAKRVAAVLDARLADVGHTALIFEGYGVDHVHAKLFPTHGTRDLGEWKPIHSRVDTFFERYEGYVSSHDHRRADDADLAKLAAVLRGDDQGPSPASR